MEEAIISDRFDALVCDLDGVVYLGDEVVPGVPHAIHALRASGVQIVFCTNNATRKAVDFADKLTRLGIEASAGDVLTSAEVTAETLAARGHAGKSVLVVGSDALREALDTRGLAVSEDEGAEVVVVGLDPRFDYAAMQRAARAVAAGAIFIATNDDATLPVPGGVRPGAGAILASIEIAAGRKAEVMGKPHDPMMDAAAARVEGAATIAIAGDRPETDLAGGAARGWTTILVLSGVTRAEDVADIRPQPDLVVDSLADLSSASQ